MFNVDFEDWQGICSGKPYDRLASLKATLGKTLASNVLTPWRLILVLIPRIDENVGMAINEGNRSNESEFDTTFNRSTLTYTGNEAEANRVDYTCKACILYARTLIPLNCCLQTRK